MKIAVTGKGGVGKTAVAAALALHFKDAGFRVVAVDADPDTNLAGTLGYRGAEIPPLSEMKAFIEQRVGGWGGFLKMNPRVDDIPKRFGVEVEGVLVLVMGTIDRGRKGCACPENVLLREVLGHLMLQSDERVVVDMEAGLEHLGRGTAEDVEHMLVVVEPGWASVQTAKRIAKLAGDLGVGRVHAVANKIATEEHLAFIRASLDDLPLLGWLPFDEALEEDGRRGRFGENRLFRKEMRELARRLDREEREPG